MSSVEPNVQHVVVHQDRQTTAGLIGLIFSVLGWITCGLLCIPGAIFSFIGLFGKGQKSFAIAGLIVGFPGTLFFIFFGLTILMTFLGIGAAATTVAAGTAAAMSEQYSADLDSMDSTPMIDSPVEIVEEALPTVEEPTPSPSESTPPSDSIGPDVEPKEALAEVEGSELGFETNEAPEPMNQIEIEVPAEPEPSPPTELELAEAALSMFLEENSLPEFVQSELRGFTDATGKFTVQARVVGIDPNTVDLEQENGKLVSLPIVKLSGPDKQFLFDKYKDYVTELRAYEAKRKQLEEAVENLK